MALRKITLSLAAVAAMATGSFAADANATFGNGLADAFSKGKVDGQLRGMYEYQNNQTFNNKPNNNNSAFAAGGNLGFTTAPYYGIQAGAKFYTTQVLASSANFNGKPAGVNQASLASYVENAASTSGSTPQSYSVLGQAFVQGTYGKTIAKVGRQQLDTPLAGSDDNYMIPNLFQAGVLINQDIPQTTLVAAYVNGMMGGTTGDSHASQGLFGSTYGVNNAQTGFTSMSRAALGQAVDVNNGTRLAGGSTVGNQPVVALAAVNSSIPFTTAQLWYYNNIDVLNALYFSADIAVPVSNFKPYLSGQWYNLNSQGKTKTLLTNVGNAIPGAVNNLSYSVWGVKGGLETPIGLTPEVAGNFVQGKNSTAYVFNAWGGTPNYTDMAFVNISNFASYAGGLVGGNTVSARGLNVFKASLTQDLSKFNLGDRSVQVAFGSYDFSKSNNNGNNVDTQAWDVVYSCKNALVKNLEMKLFWENVKYNSAWQNVSATGSQFQPKTTDYVFARGIYSF